MSSFRCPILFLLLAVLAGATGAIASAGEPDRDGQRRGERDRSEQRKQASRDDDDTLSEAVRRVERATQGQILSAERVQFDGRDIHRVKVVDDRGRVRIYVDDPEKSTDSDDGKRSPRTRRDDRDTPNL